MFAKIKTACVKGINGVMTEVETYIGNGLPSFEIIGKAEAAIKESRERIKAVLKNGGYDAVTRKITINLYPADIVKKGSHFDLPIAIGVLVASGQLKVDGLKQMLEETAFFGELSLDGHLKQVKGILSMAESALHTGIKNIIVPIDNVAETKYIEGVQVFGFERLDDVITFIKDKMMSRHLCKSNAMSLMSLHQQTVENLSDVKGHEEVKRVMEIAAAGGHSLLLIGSPGAGKSMLAKRMSTILPEMSPQEIFEVAKIKSIVGEPVSNQEVRPFRMLHHSCTKAAMLGGGKELVPGEITMAHNGVLFLDELAEFSPGVLDGLRLPMEDGYIVLSRASGSVRYPSNFMLVAAANPCMCGRLLEGKDKCRCTQFQRENYLHKISGPLLDRIDLRVNVFSMKYEVLAGKTSEQTDEMTSEAVKKRVTLCRDLQLLRYKNEDIDYNAQLQYRMLNKYCKLEKGAEELLQKVINTGEHSGRYYARVLKTARTIADMETIREKEKIDRVEFDEYDLFEKKIGLKHVAEAIKYKVSDRIL